MKKKGLFKRIIAGLLCLSFAFAYMPSGTGDELFKALDTITAMAAAANNNSTTESPASVSNGEDSSDDTSAADATEYRVDSDGSTVSFDAYANMEKWKDRKTFKAPSNTYTFTVSTGATAGDTIIYFGIRYLDTSGKSRTQYVFPKVDAYDRTNAMLNYYAEGKDITETYGSEVIKDYNYKETVKPITNLDSWSNIDYAFQTVAEIKQVKSMEIYMESGSIDEATGKHTKSGWTAQGIAVYKVESYKGYEEYGLISGQQFLDYEGYLVADIQRTSSETLATSGTDKVFIIGEGGTNSSSFKLNTYAKNKKPKTYATESQMYTLRMDFSDIKGGGMESFLNPSADNVNDYDGIVENLAIEIQYQDIHKWTRKVTLPVVLSSYVMVGEQLKGEVIYGFGLRGDTIAFEGLFPDFSMLLSSTLYSGTRARDEIAANGIETDIVWNNMKSNLSETQSDKINLAGISMYQGGCRSYLPGGIDTDGQKLKGATVEYVYGSADPFMYYTTTEETGRELTLNGKDKITMIKYNHGNPLLGFTPGEGTYLIDVATSDKKSAAINGDVSMKFIYTDSSGNQKNTTPCLMKKAASAFMGEWATKKNGDFITEQGIAPGGHLKFIVEAPDAFGFTGMQLSLNGSGIWIMDNVTISYVEQYGKRRAYRKDVSQNGSNSNFWLERDIIAGEILRLDETHPVITDDSEAKLDLDEALKELDEADDDQGMGDRKANTSSDASANASSNALPKFDELLVMPERTYTISFDSDNTVDVRDTDYSEVRYNMTHEQAEMDWGFFKKRKTYNIGINVAPDDIMDLGNGDAGSSNHFYFQLVFANGNSAYVLANQQLTSDGFRSGVTERFSISTNQDYGKIKGIRIIPEDLSDDTNPFDKLNIDSIDISEDTSGGCYLTYIIDDVGWIDIEYYDKEETISLRGRQGRTQTEIARYYPLSYTTTSVKVLCELTLGGWSSDDLPFEGAVKATVNYTDTDNNSKNMTMDVVKQIAAYDELSVNAVESTNGSATAAATNADGIGFTSNPDWMFRAGHTDRFTFDPIVNLKRINSIEFTVTSQNNSTAIWNIKSISISQVIKDGALQMGVNDEFVRNMETIPLTSVTPEDGGDQFIARATCQAGMPTTIGPIEFGDHKFEWTSEEWVTPVTRTPETKDDELNVYVYPSTSSYKAVKKNDAAGSKAKTVKSSIVYELPYSQYLVASASKMFLGEDANGNMMYYAKGLSAKNMINLGKMVVSCADSGILFNHAVVQHVRNGVVMGTYSYYLLDQSGTMGGATATAVGSNSYSDKTEEELYIALDEDTKEQSLVAESSDIAVSFYYTSSIDDVNDVKTTYQSPYIYLSDLGYTKVSGGEMLKIPTDIEYVQDITGFTISAYGAIKGRVNGAAAQVFKVDEEVLDATAKDGYSTTARSKRSYAGFNRAFDLTNKHPNHKVTSKKFYGEGSVTPVEVTFKTAASSMTLDSKAKSAISMIFNYTDYMGVSKAITLNDVCKFIDGDNKKLLAGEEQTIKFFIPEINDKLNLTTAEIFFASEEDYWNIDTVNCNLGFDTRVIGTTGVQTFFGTDDECILRLNDVNMVTKLYKSSGGDIVTVEDHEYQMVCESGDEVNGTTTLTGSTSGVSVKAYRMVGDAPDELTGKELKITKNGFRFTVPNNDTGSIVKYKIVISPNDDPTQKDIIWVTVESGATSPANTYTTEAPSEDPGDSDPDSE
ncbi:MAG: hypothetical protein K5656_01535 [Lachnospiraceae bacterium]|nr:hypothetical protein [Lachnospiraceae bacterium]